MNDITFEQAWNYGGPLMWVLALFSVWALRISLVFPARRNSRSRGGLAHLRVEGPGIGGRQSR